MRLHNEVVARRTELLKGFFKANPHSGIKQAQKFLSEKNERSMNHRTVYQIRDEVRKELFGGRSAGASVPEAKGKSDLAPPILSASRALASMMKVHNIESMTLSFSGGKPVLSYSKLAPVQKSIEITSH